MCVCVCARGGRGLQLMRATAQPHRPTNPLRSCAVRRNKAALFGLEMTPYSSRLPHLAVWQPGVGRALGVG